MTTHTTAGLRTPIPPADPAESSPTAPDGARDESLRFSDAREQALLQAHRAGDPRALEELLLAVQPRLFSICFRMARDAGDARDLCQDALAKIIHGLPGFTGRSRLSTWMIRIAMNVCLTDRRRGRLRQTTSLDAASPDGADRPITDRLANPREQATHRRVEQGEDLRRLSEALARLDPDQRAILILRDGQGLDYADIGEALDIPVGTVKSRLFRARVALRQEIESPGSRRTIDR